MIHRRGKVEFKTGPDPSESFGELPPNFPIRGNWAEAWNAAKSSILSLPPSWSQNRAIKGVRKSLRCHTLHAFLIPHVYGDPKPFVVKKIFILTCDKIIAVKIFLMNLSSNNT